jgi:predicted porin
MNVSLVRRFATPVLLASIYSTCAAQSSVTISGIMDATVLSGDSGPNRLTQLLTGGYASSRIGFRGAEDLGGGLSAVFRVEMGVNLDTGTLGQGGRAFGRESSVGVSSKQWGTVLAGRLPTPYYLSYYRTDAFLNTMSGSVAAITRNTAGGQRQLGPAWLTARADNAFKYISPTLLGGLTFELMTNLTENSTVLGRQTYALANYKTNKFELLLTGGELKAGPSGAGSSKGVGLGGSYDFGPARLYAGAIRERNDCTTCTGLLARPIGVTGEAAGDFRIFNVGVRIPFGAATAIVQGVRVQDRSQYAVATGNRDANFFAVGGEYSLSKRTLLWGSFGTISNRNGSSYALGAGSAQQPAAFVAGAGDAKATSIAMGIVHRF